MPSKNIAEYWVGIDVSKDWVDVIVLLEEKKAERFRSDRTGPALAELAKKLLLYDPQGIVLEATGGLEVPVIVALTAAGLKVMRMNPKRVRDFANGMGFLAKTDVLDAHVLALFGARARPPYRAFPAADGQHLAAIMARVQQLTAERAADRTRLHQTTEPSLKKRVERMIAYFGKEIALLEKQMAAAVAKSETGRRKKFYCAPRPAWGPKRRSCYWPSYRSLARSTVAKLRRWWGWLRSPLTAVMTKANVTSGEAAAGFAPLATSPVGRPPEFLEP